MPLGPRIVRRLCVLAAAVVPLAMVSPGPVSASTPVVSAAGGSSYNGLALTPPMGFNDWAGFGCNSQMNESLFTKTADALVNSGLDKLGYDYVNLDDCWMQRDRDAAGNLQVDPARFPHG